MEWAPQGLNIRYFVVKAVVILLIFSKSDYYLICPKCSALVRKIKLQSHLQLSHSSVNRFSAAFLLPFAWTYKQTIEQTSPPSLWWRYITTKKARVSPNSWNQREDISKCLNRMSSARHENLTWWILGVLWQQAKLLQYCLQLMESYLD